MVLPVRTKGANSEIFQLTELLCGSLLWSLHCLGEECAVSLLHSCSYQPSELGRTFFGAGKKKTQQTSLGENPCNAGALCSALS